VKYIFRAVKKVIVSAKYFTAWKKFTPYILHEHHSPTVNVVVLLNHAYLQRCISVICFKHWSLKVIIIQNRYNRFWRSDVDGYTGVCYGVSLLKNTQLQFVSFVFIEQFFIYENATECSQVLSLHDERDIYFWACIVQFSKKWLRNVTPSCRESGEYCCV